MTLHAGSLEQFMLKRRMGAEIKRQKSLPPRWRGRMIFLSPAMACAFLDTLEAPEESNANKLWQHATAIVAMTYDFYCSKSEAEYTVCNLMRLLQGQEVQPEEDMPRIAGDSEDIEIGFLVGGEIMTNRFVLLGDDFVPVAD
tara:strand:- start:99 stop:524 length:426 start_codon:yes stop_codon:yes gene_type:complete